MIAVTMLLQSVCQYLGTLVSVVSVGVIEDCLWKTI